MMVHENINKEKLQQTIQKGLNWLTSSDIYCDNGGMRSKYDPKTKQYEIWKEGNTDVLCTSGLVEVIINYSEMFNDDQYDDQLLRSVNHLCDLWDDEKGLMWAGQGSKWIYPFWASNAAYVLYDYYEKTKHERSKNIAEKIIDWLISIQNPDGAIPKNQIWSGKIDKKPVTSWNTILIRAFLKADEMGHIGAQEAALRLSEWMLANQLKDGSYYYSFDSINNIYRNIKDRKEHAISLTGAMKKHTLWKHPTSQANCLLASLLLYERNNDEKMMRSALQTHKWISHNLSPRNIMYEKYYLNSHSMQEDVYPTALFVNSILILYDITGKEKYLTEAKLIWKDMINVQFDSEDKNLHGSFPGVPLHPTEGGKAYAWDTIGAVYSLMELYKRII